MSCTDLKSLRISKCFKYSELVPFSQKIQSTVEELDLCYNFLGQRLFHLIAKLKNIKSFKQSLSLPYSSYMYQKNKKRMFESDDDYNEQDYNYYNIRILLLQYCNKQEKRTHYFCQSSQQQSQLFTYQKKYYQIIRLKKAKKAKKLG